MILQSLIVLGAVAVAAQIGTRLISGQEPKWGMVAVASGLLLFAGGVP
jgi:hypothetical protein